MRRRPFNDMPDRITIRRRAPVLAPREMRRQLWTLVGGVVGSLILLWVMVQLGQASTDSRPAANTGSSAMNASVQMAIRETPGEAAPPAAPVSTTDKVSVQGPAVEEPREVLAMLDLRKQDLDRRETAVRKSEERLAAMKAELEEILARSEASQKHLEDARSQLAKEQQESKSRTQKQMAEQKTQQDRFLAERKALAAKQSQEQKSQTQTHLAKILESMPPEEAAARLEQMPERKATEMLRLVKGKTASAILAQMKTSRAAKLTEQLLEPAP